MAVLNCITMKIGGAVVKVDAYTWKTYHPERVCFDIWEGDAVICSNVTLECVIGTLMRKTLIHLQGITADNAAKENQR